MLRGMAAAKPIDQPSLLALVSLQFRSSTKYFITRLTYSIPIDYFNVVYSYVTLLETRRPGCYSLTTFRVFPVLLDSFSKLCRTLDA